MGLIAIPNIDALRQYAPQNNNAVIVMGTSSINDGGGGIFYFIPNSLAVDNGTTIIRSRNGVGCWFLNVANSIGGTDLDLAPVALAVADATLPRGRVLTAGTNVTLTDAGPGGALTIAASGGGGGTFSNAVLAADFPKTNNTLANVTGFTFAIAANEKWTCTYTIFLASSASAQFDVTGPASPTTVLFSDVTNFGSFVSAFSTPYAGLGGGNFLITLVLNVQNGANAGNVQLRFAQDVTSGTPITIKAGSAMVAQKVS